MPRVSDIAKRLETEAKQLESEKSEQRHIDVPKVIQVATVGKNAIYVNGQLYNADVQDSQPGKVIKVANVGRPAAAKYKQLTVGDVHDIAVANAFNKMYAPLADQLIQSMKPVTGIENALSNMTGLWEEQAKQLTQVLQTAILPSLDFSGGWGIDSIQQALQGLGQSTFVDLSKIKLIFNRDMERLGDRFRAYLEQQKRIKEACETLGIDTSSPDSVDEAYKQMEMDQLLREAENARQIEQIIREVNPATARMLMGRFLKQPTQTRGRKPEQHYMTAFERVYVLKTHSIPNAFNAMLFDEEIVIIDESDRAGRYNAFVTALKRFKRKFLH